MTLIKTLIITYFLWDQLVHRLLTEVDKKSPENRFHDQGISRHFFFSLKPEIRHTVGPLDNIISAYRSIKHWNYATLTRVGQHCIIEAENAENRVEHRRCYLVLYQICDTATLIVPCRCRCLMICPIMHDLIFDIFDQISLSLSHQAYLWTCH